MPSDLRVVCPEGVCPRPGYPDTLNVWTMPWLVQACSRCSQSGSTCFNSSLDPFQRDWRDKGVLRPTERALVSELLSATMQTRNSEHDSKSRPG